MPINDQTLIGLTEFVRQYAVNQLEEKNLANSLSIDSIILYGGAARYHMGQVAQYNDYDLNVFFQRLTNYQNRDARHFNRRGRYWNAGIFEQRDVQVLFNVLLNGESWIRSARNRQSARWNRIRSNPVLLLFPNRTDYNNL